MTVCLDFLLTQQELAWTRAFFDRLDHDKKRYFSADDFRAYGLDKYMRKRDKELGGYFAKLVANRLIVRRGDVPSVTPSNNLRHNFLFERTGLFEQWLREQQRL